MNTQHTLMQHATQVLKNAYAPYSRFQVACCLRSEKNRFYAGCNIENASYGLTSCAEANAIAHLIAAGEKKIAEALILIDRPHACSPCGACRQRLIEFAPPSSPIHLATLTGIQQTLLLGDLLPHTFTASIFQEN
jgi:cytidine deaminase